MITRIGHFVVIIALCTLTFVVANKGAVAESAVEQKESIAHESVSEYVVGQHKRQVVIKKDAQSYSSKVARYDAPFLRDVSIVITSHLYLKNRQLLI